MLKFSLLLSCILLLVNSQQGHGNTLFHFGFHFQVKDGSSSAEEETRIDKSMSVHNNHIAITDNLATETSTATTISTITAAPLADDWDAIWVEQQQLNATATDKIQLTRSAIFKLNQELIEVVGRSDVLAAKAKLTTRYINSVDALLENQDGNAASKFTLLRQFVELVDQLREVSVQRSVDFLALKLLLEKYKILELQSDVHKEVVEAEKAWQRYVKAKLVEVSV